MSMSDLRSRINNVTTFTVATMFAYGFAFFVVTSVIALSGAEEAQAPLLVTLTFATIASGLVGAVTATTVSKGPSAKMAEQRGNAAFVFSNSSGTFITLVTAAAECWEAHEPKDDTGLALLLAALRVDDKELAFGFYFWPLVLLSVIALAFVLIGASQLNRHEAQDEEGLELVRFCSVGLLVIGLAAGTPWGVIPYGAREVADIWAIVGCIVAFLISVAVFSFVVSRGFGAFCSLLVHGLIHAGVHLKSLSKSQKFKKGFRQFAVGCLRLLVPFLSVQILLTAADAMFTGKEAATIAAFSQSLKPAATALILTAASIALVLVCLLLWPALGPLAEQLRAQLRRASSFAKAALRSLGRRLVRCRDACLQALRHLKLRPMRKSPFVGPRLPFSRVLLKVVSAIGVRVGVFGRDWARVVRSGARNFGLAYIPRSPLFRRAVLGAMAIFFMGSLITREEPSSALVDMTVPPTQVPELIVEPTELDWVPSQVSPRLENVRTSSVSLCELPAGAADWANGSDDRFEIPLVRCLLPSDVQQSRGALVLVGLASSIGNAEREDRRALSRGTALAQWAYLQLPNQNDIYVLHLGTAQRVIPLRRYRDFFGNAVGERPVAGLIVAPEPEEAILYTFDVAEQLSQYMVSRGVADDFTRCTLYHFRPAAPDKGRLQLVESFNCNRSD
jgi:hypothetical protein